MIMVSSSCSPMEAGGCGRAMILGNFKVSRHPTNWIMVWQGHASPAVGVNGDFWVFLSLITPLFFLPLSWRRLDIVCKTVYKSR